MNEWMRLRAESSPAIWVGRGSWMAQGCAIRCVRIAASLLDGGRHFHGRLARLAVSGTSSSANSRASNVMLCRVAVARIGKSAVKRICNGVELLLPPLQTLQLSAGWLAGMSAWLRARRR